jgi:hypothetical protein
LAVFAVDDETLGAKSVHMYCIMEIPLVGTQSAICLWKDFDPLLSPLGLADQRLFPVLSLDILPTLAQIS